MAIGWDLDDTRVPYVAPCFSFHNRQYSTALRVEHCHERSLASLLGISIAEEQERLAGFHASTDFQSLQPLDGALELVDKVKGIEPVQYSITARPPELVEFTLAWEQRHFPGRFAGIHFSRNKDMSYGRKSKAQLCLENHVRIHNEDVVHDALECAEAGVTVLLHDRPWNRACPSHQNIIRVQSYEEVYHHIRRIYDTCR